MFSVFFSVRQVLVIFILDILIFFYSLMLYLMCFCLICSVFNMWLWSGLMMMNFLESELNCFSRVWLLYTCDLRLNIRSYLFFMRDWCMWTWRLSVSMNLHQQLDFTLLRCIDLVWNHTFCVFRRFEWILDSCSFC